ncbi:MAG: hypothetical protein HN443_07560 [Flavobacteriaceae bacterium]|nr:hypothetical protein [Flavobacteriaceae bacterium]
MEYDFLRQLGVDWIQRISGKKWTDYNYHDPGITFLEQLCYALTDLGYRTNFPIQDILLSSNEDFDLEKNNLLIPANKIFSSAPLNLLDFRKIIIQQIPNVKNAWIKSVEENQFGFKGIYNVLIQCDEEIGYDEINDIKSQVDQLLMQDRSLCTDFQDIKILQKDTLSISAQISLDSFVLGESVLAEVYQKIEKTINPSVPFLEYDDMIAKGYSPLDLFTGPPVTNGFVDETDLKSKTNEIYVSEIKELIENIEGVVSVDQIDVFKNGIKVFDDLIPFGEDNYPSLEKNIQNYHNASERILFFRNNNKYEIDTVILSQLYDALTVASKTSFFKPRQIESKDFISRFSKKEVEEYFSIQNELPSIYGLKQNELSSSANSKRKAQSKQLKAYLTFFEQVMSNHLSQLINLRNIFSIQKEIDQSYFTQIPYSIPDLKSILVDKDLDQYQQKLQAITESDEKKYIRRNHMIDHLLSRFGESFNSNLLQKLIQSSNDHLIEGEIQKIALDKKIDFAEEIVNLGKNRIKGFNFSLPTWDHQNISGLELRLKLMFGIQNKNIRSLVAPIVENYQKKPSKENWRVNEVQIIKGAKTKTLSKADDYSADEVSIYCPDPTFFKSLFIFAPRSKTYRIVPTRVNKKVVYNILFKIPNQEYPAVIYRAPKKKDCEEKLEQIKERFRTFNNECEGMFVLEHILLRPLVSNNYFILFKNDQGEEFLKSYRASSFEDQREFRDDIYVLGVNSENYSVQKVKGKKSFKIVLFDILNNPVFESVKVFNTKEEGLAEITKFIDFFQGQKSNKTDLKDLSSINIDVGNSHEFPVDFDYSNTLSIILPNWPFRFQNNEFLDHFKEEINHFIPAHIKFEIYLLEVDQLVLFEETYLKWLKSKMDRNNDVSDLMSMQLIQLLQRYNPLP